MGSVENVGDDLSGNKDRNVSVVVLLSLHADSLLDGIVGLVLHVRSPILLTVKLNYALLSSGTITR